MIAKVINKLIILPWHVFWSYKMISGLKEYTNTKSYLLITKLMKPQNFSSRSFINVFSRSTNDFHKQAKLVELNFFIEKKFALDGQLN